MRLAALSACLAVPGFADAPAVVAVAVEGNTVTVTLSHPDTGWDHDADGWEVLDAEANSLGFRELLHPHVTEQTFTRALSGVIIPEGATSVFVRARCTVDGWSHDHFEVVLAR